MSKEKAGGSYGSLNCNFCGKTQKEVKKLIASDQNISENADYLEEK